MRRQIWFDADHEGRCFGCGPANPSGLKLRFYETADGAETEYVVASDLDGAPGIVHGGIQATLLDEVMCMTAYAKAGTGVVTGELTVRYLRPVPSGTPLILTGRITETRGRSFFIAGSIRLAAGGEELTRAQGRFFAAAPSDTQETTA